VDGEGLHFVPWLLKRGIQQGYEAPQLSPSLEYRRRSMDKAGGEENAWSILIPLLLFFSDPRGLHRCERTSLEWWLV
jgi:hypothetical protein